MRAGQPPAPGSALTRYAGEGAGAGCHPLPPAPCTPRALAPAVRACPCHGAGCCGRCSSSRHLLAGPQRGAGARAAGRGQPRVALSVSAAAPGTFQLLRCPLTPPPALGIPGSWAWPRGNQGSCNTTLHQQPLLLCTRQLGCKGRRLRAGPCRCHARQAPTSHPSNMPGWGGGRFRSWHHGGGYSPKSEGSECAPGCTTSPISLPHNLSLSSNPPARGLVHPLGCSLWPLLMSRTAAALPVSSPGGADTAAPPPS